MIMALFFILLAIWSQSQLAALQEPKSEAAPALEILYSKRVVTRGAVIAAAVHVSDGRVQSIMPMRNAPKGPKVRSTASQDPPTAPGRSLGFIPDARSSTNDLTFAPILPAHPTAGDRLRQTRHLPGPRGRPRPPKRARARGMGGL